MPSHEANAGKATSEKLAELAELMLQLAGTGSDAPRRGAAPC